MTIYGQKVNNFEIKQGNTWPYIATVLLDGDQQPLDLTSATSVKFKMAMCEHPRTVILNEVAADFNATPAGEVWYEWGPTDTDIPGKYNIEWIVTYPVFGPMTVPSKGYDTVEVTKSL